ncbi:MAG: M15 family metallopeptidase [Candidatus Saccharimonadales bacterium]
MAIDFDEPDLREREVASAEGQPTDAHSPELDKLNNFNPSADASRFASGPLKGSSNAMPGSPTSGPTDAQPASTKPKPADTPAGGGNVDTGLYSGSYPKRKIKGWANKQKAAAVGGVTAALIGLSAAFVSPFTNMLPFLDFGKAISVHSEGMSDGSDMRMTGLYRYARTGNAGETRIGQLESMYINKMQADMEKAGIKPVFDGRSGQYRGIRIDTKAENSPYKGMTDEEVKKRVESKFGTDAFVERDGQLFLNEDGKGFLTQYRSLKTISKEMGTSGVMAAIRARPMAKKANISLHPLTKLENKTQTLGLKAYDALRERRKTAINGADSSVSRVDTRGAVQESDDKKSTSPVDGSEQTVDSKNSKTVLQQMGSGKALAVTGGVGAIVAVSCLSRDLAVNIGEYAYDITATDSMRLGMHYTALSSQVEASSDFDPESLDVEYEYMSSTDEDGNVSDYSQSELIRANNGGEGGVPLNPAVLQSLKAVVPSWLQWAVSDKVAAVCSTAGQIIIGGASLVATIASGGTISALVGIAATPITNMIREKAIDIMTVYISGEGANLAEKKGPEMANYAELGNFLFFNGTALHSGGSALSPAETAQLTEYNKAYDDFAFERQPLKEKVFNVKDKRSLTGKIARAYPTSVKDASSDIASLFTNSFGSLVSGFGSLNPKASAAPITYDYGIPKFGYSISELSDKRFQDPYKNASIAAVLFDSGSGGNYIEKARKCFGVQITKSAESGWGTQVVDDAYRNYFTGDKNKDCDANKTDENWSRTRLFIFDTGTMEAYACMQGDATSCTNSGFGTDVPATTAATGSVNVAELRKDSTGVACAAGTTDVGIQDGYTEGTLVKIRICAIPGIKSANGSLFAGDGGNVVVNSRLSGAWLALAQKAKADGVTLTTNSGFRTMAAQQKVFERNGRDSRAGATPGYSNHQMGLAIDFQGTRIINTSAQNCSTRVIDPGSSVWTWLNNNTAAYGIKQYSAESWHWDPDPGGLGNRCGGDGTLRT